MLVLSRMMSAAAVPTVRSVIPAVPPEFRTRAFAAVPAAPAATVEFSNANVQVSPVTEPPAEEDVADDAEEASDLVDRLVAAMEELDDGAGVKREELVATVTAETSAGPGEVDDAITKALMDGRCYEPSEDVLRAI